MQSWILLSEIIRNYGLLIGGAIGLYLAWLRVSAANKQAEAAIQQSEIAIRQSELARRTHVVEQFNKAAGQLADPKLEIRLAAVYTLGEIGKDFPDLGGVVFELLSAYLRANSAKFPLEDDLPADIREITAILRDKLEQSNE